MSETTETFHPAEQFKGKGPSYRQRFVRWFHNNRLMDLASLVDPGEVMLSVGAGNAELESKVIDDKFDTIYTLEPVDHRAKAAGEKGLASLRGSVPPIPFRNESLDAILISGTIEHLPDERGFIEDATRCLKDGGRLYVTLPVEIGVGGLIRYLGKNFVNPTRNDSPDGLGRYLDYSLEELLKRTPRDKHGISHRYYNYTYALDDIEDCFSDMEVRGWPFEGLGALNLILFVVAEK